MIILDTSGLFAAIDSSQRHHAAAADAARSDEPRILSPFVLAELDYLITTRVSRIAAVALLEEVARSVYRLETFDASDISTTIRINEQYADLGLGLADASIVVLAQRYRCHNVLTLDDRHFRAVLGPGDEPFRLLPADA